MASRDHFRAIAKRNSASSESLVRLHLSDRAALGPALGWEEIQLVNSSDRHESSAVAGGVFTNTSALDTIMDAIHIISEQTGYARRDVMQISFAATNATSGVLTIRIGLASTHSIRAN